jgi:hypothetical protein
VFPWAGARVLMAVCLTNSVSSDKSFDLVKKVSTEMFSTVKDFCTSIGISLKLQSSSSSSLIPKNDISRQEQILSFVINLFSQFFSNPELSKKSIEIKITILKVFSLGFDFLPLALSIITQRNCSSVGGSSLLGNCHSAATSPATATACITDINTSSYTASCLSARQKPKGSSTHRTACNSSSFAAAVVPRSTALPITTPSPVPGASAPSLPFWVSCINLAIACKESISGKICKFQPGTIFLFFLRLSENYFKYYYFYSYCC